MMLSQLLGQSHDNVLIMSVHFSLASYNSTEQLLGQSHDNVLIMSLHFGLSSYQSTEWLLGQNQNIVLIMSVHLKKNVPTLLLQPQKLWTCSVILLVVLSEMLF